MAAVSWVDREPWVTRLGWFTACLRREMSSKMWA